MYISEIVGTFLAHIPQLSLSILHVSVLRSLRGLIEATTDGNIAAFSRNVGLPKTTVWELVQGRFPPSLPFLLQLCYQFRLSLLQILIGSEHIALGKSPLSQEQARKRGVRRPFDREKVQLALGDILADQQGVPLSMREVAQRLGYPVRTIMTHFPAPCREISRRYAEYRKQLGQSRKAALKQRITEAACIVHVQGEKLTYQRVGSVVGKPGCFRECEARLALLDIRCRSDEQKSLE
jgi:hypothetical protein